MKMVVAIVFGIVAGYGAYFASHNLIVTGCTAFVVAGLFTALFHSEDEL